jgi:hypothetical protein
MGCAALKRGRGEQLPAGGGLRWQGMPAERLTSGGTVYTDVSEPGRSLGGTIRR